MYKPVSWLGGMAYSAITQGAVVPLQRDEFDGVVELAAGRDSMRTIMTGLTVEPTMANGLVVQRGGGIETAPIFGSFVN
jgi:hypothetical protein